MVFIYSAKEDCFRVAISNQKYHNTNRQFLNFNFIISCHKWENKLRKENEI